MNIQHFSQTRFNGYDARQLKGFLMNSNCHGIATEMKSIGKKEGFKVFSVINNKNQTICSETTSQKNQHTNGIWAQDLWTIVKNKILAFEVDERTFAIKDFFKLKLDSTQHKIRQNPYFQMLNTHLWQLATFIASEDFKIFPPEATIPLLMEFERGKNSLKEMQNKAHIPGGNFFLIKGKNNNEELIIGESALKDFSLEQLKSMYCAEKITVLPQMDYHLDLFIRPLDKKRILVADDFLTLETLAGGLKNLVNFITSRPVGERKKYKNMFLQFGSRVKNFQNIINMNPRCQVDEICEILEVNGYKPIRVPGRIYDIYESTQAEPFLSHHCNYINANALINDNKELVYITNKSNIDKTLGLTQKMSEKINFSFEKSFLKSISPYINPEHIYFVKGDNNFVANEMLTTYQGGIHCTCSEVPKINKRNSYDSSSKNKHRV